MCRPFQQAKQLTLYIDSDYDLGLHLADAPEIIKENFFGREHELQTLKETLAPEVKSDDQKIAITAGLGGMGKTQLAISFAKKMQREFSAVFWINAKSEILLRRSILALIPRISLASTPKEHDVGGDEDRGVVLFRNWLSRQGNTRWLLIYDNYDEPENYRIKQYFPYRAQGSILITTRSSFISFGKVLKLKPLQKEQGLQVLATRSGRPQTMEGMYRLNVL